MSVMLKRSTTTAIPNECPYGCCTTLYGKNVKKVRRMVRRAEKRAWRMEVE